MKRKTGLICFILTALLPLQTIAQSGKTPINVRLADEAAIVMDGQTITIGDAIRMALETNSDVLAGKYDLAMADSNYKKYSGKYSPYLGASIGISSNKYSVPVSGSDESLNLIQGSGAVSFGKNFSTGTKVGVGLQQSYFNADVPDLGRGIPIPAGKQKLHRPVLYVNLEQDLLQNAFGYEDRRQLDILKKASEIQKDRTKFYLSQIVVGVITQYWNVILYKTRLDNARTMLTETRRVRQIVGGNVRLGIAEQYQLNFWNTILASSETSVTRAEQEFKDAARDLQRMFNIEEGGVHEATVLCSAKPDTDIEEALKTAYEKRADYLAAVKSYEAASIQLEIASNAGLPSLKGGITLSTSDSNEKLGVAYGNSARMKSPSIEASLQMSYVLDNRNQKTEERDARWKVEQAKINVAYTKRLVKDDVNSKAEWLNTGYELYQKAKVARMESETYYNKIIANLRQGRLTATAVREALNNMVTCRNNELALLIGYNAYILQFDVAKNTLFEKYGIDIEAYMPEE